MILNGVNFDTYFNEYQYKIVLNMYFVFLLCSKNHFEANQKL